METRTGDGFSVSFRNCSAAKLRADGARYLREQRVGSPTTIALPMAQHVELAGGKTKCHLMEKSGFDAGCGDGSGDRGSTKPRLNCAADGFVGWQLQ